MKLTMLEVRETLAGLNEIAKMEMPVVIAMKVARIIRQLRPEDEILQQAIQNLFIKYGKQDGKNYKIESGSPEMHKFIEEEKELMESTTELPIIPLSLDGIGNISGELILAVYPILEGSDE